jgi:hypothetical protein
VERPTTLKLHEFANDSFVHGCYIPHKICDDLIDYFNDTPDRHESGQVYGTCEKHINELIEDTATKKSTDIHFYLHQVEDALILNDYITNLNLCIQEYEYKYERAKKLAQYGIRESVNLQKYEPTEGFKSWHCERDGKAQQTRCLAYMTYLNDVPAGGTEFMYQKITIPAIKGLTVIWPSDWTHTHRGQISNEYKKYVLTGWFNYIL